MTPPVLQGFSAVAPEEASCLADPLVTPVSSMHKAEMAEWALSFGIGHTLTPCFAARLSAALRHPGTVRALNPLERRRVRAHTQIALVRREEEQGLLFSCLEFKARLLF